MNGDGGFDVLIMKINWTLYDDNKRVGALKDTLSIYKRIIP